MSYRPRYHCPICYKDMDETSDGDWRIKNFWCPKCDKIFDVPAYMLDNGDEDE